MPKKLERKLAREARAKHLSAKRRQAYIFGGLRREGWKPKKRGLRRI